MKNILVILFFIFVGGMGATTQAHAFYLQQSMGLYPNYSPYPSVLGSPIDILPQGFITINVGDEVFYYCDGVFYQMIMRDQNYVIVPPPIGAVVFNIPMGHECMLINGVTYYEYQGVYYKRVLEGYRVTYPPL